MSTANSPLTRATRKMFVASIDAIGDGIVGLVLQTARRGNTYCIALPVSNPAIAAFGDEYGQFDSLLELQGNYATVHFCEPITDAEIEYTQISKIKKVKGKA